MLYACIGLSIESIDIPILEIDEQAGRAHFTIAAPQAENVFNGVDWTQLLFPQGHGFERSGCLVCLRELFVCHVMGARALMRMGPG